MTRSVWLTALTAMCLSATPGTTHAASERERESPATPWLSKYTFEWGFSANFGVAFGESDELRHLESLGVRVGRVMTGPIGPGVLRGQLAVNVEILPVFLFSESDTTYAAGFNLLARHYFERRHRLRPFLTLGAGALGSASEIPDGTARLNFMPQIGFGVAFSDRRDFMYTFEYRFHHISNGSRVDPNPGVNSSVIQFGVTFLRLSDRQR